MITDLYAHRPEGVSSLERLPLKSCLKCAKPRQKILCLVEDAGFKPVLWEDHSHLLKQLAAKIFFQLEFMKEFWTRFAPHCAPQDLTAGREQASPGYYLMVARKKGGF